MAGVLIIDIFLVLVFFNKVVVFTLKHENSEIIIFTWFTMDTRSVVDFDCFLCSTYVSFSVEDDSLSFGEVRELIMERMDTLAELDFEILELSQGQFESYYKCQSVHCVSHEY